MNRNTIRLISLLGAFSIIGIIITQIHWVKKAYALQELQLNREIYFALKNVANNIYEANGINAPDHKIVNHVEKDYFAVRLTNSIDHDVLEHLLKRELQRRNLTMDFEFGTYDCHLQTMTYGNYVSFARNPSNNFKKTQFPVWSNDSYYFSINFPHKNLAIIKGIGAWSFSSALALVVIVFFVYTLLIVFKQKRLSEIQKDFINNMTHEFKTPISSITICSNVLKNPEIISNPERLRNYANIINDEAVRLKNQVERILQMASIDKDKINLKCENLDIHKVIEESMPIIQPTLQSRNGKVVFDLKAEETIVKADKLHITNMLYNLLDNAIKYNKNNPEIKISTENFARDIVIKIQDNGIGMTAESQKKIFEKFYRVPTGNVYNVKGFGLGLNYVKELAKSHKGKIVVESELNKGSIFSLYLPYLNGYKKPLSHKSTSYKDEQQSETSLR
jgi:two-component system, OmpR family, phosphate regulon sensor histidine kinase PhoR